MQTYRTIIEAHTPLEAAKDSSTGTTPARETEQDGDKSSEAEMPPWSAVDTNSDGGLLGMDTFNFEPESGDESDPYAPAADEDDEEEGDPGFSDASVEQDKALKKKQRKKDKQKGKLRADIQAHRKIVTPSYAPANAQGRMQEVKGSGKSVEIGGLQKNWKERVQPPLPSSSIKPSASTKGSQQRPETRTSHLNAGGDFNNQNDSEGSQDQAPAPKKQQSLSKAKTQVNHQEGTTMVLFIYCPYLRDIRTWHESVVPPIIDWSGTLEDGFGVNAHPDLPFVVQESWNDEFPAIECNDAVLSVFLIFYRQALPYRTGAVLLSGAYCSSAIIEILAVHQQLVSKTDKFYGFPVGALSLCAAAHERALKLWRLGDPPDKDTKSSFVCKPWATRAAAHFQTIKKLSEGKWDEILEAAAAVVGSRNDELDPTGDNESELDDPNEVLISEDEAATSHYVAIQILIVWNGLACLVPDQPDRKTFPDACVHYLKSCTKSQQINVEQGNDAFPISLTQQQRLMASFQAIDHPAPELTMSAATPVEPTAMDIDTEPLAPPSPDHPLWISIRNPLTPPSPIHDVTPLELEPLEPPLPALTASGRPHRAYRVPLRFVDTPPEPLALAPVESPQPEAGPIQRVLLIM
ncbi:hypothetical protein BDZ97DRAFT_1965483 [Flammula alnicola]|nr:hypothetical protein BDZ97DRAFT_1965483 [Flammula alnicola]